MAINLHEDATETINFTIREPVDGVDVNYDPSSTNAQSGIAVAQALDKYVSIDGQTLVFGGKS